ncbi:MAG: DUF192 domain-containing protein [Hoeflea sp.]|uniref:DUF192 domain-containing protein n=1 Tax=Hoeflea sp. TaxID=1940281 RepID=UPI003EF9F56B
MRTFKQVALFFLAILIFAMPVMVVAAELPTDPERLVIETGAGPVDFSVELALSPADRASGLMNRNSMATDHGMLFKFDQSRQVLMWMKNTPLPLDMLFIDEAGVVIRIAKETTPFSETVIPSGGPVRYVLELNGGTADKRGISMGDKARHRVISK